MDPRYLLMFFWGVVAVTAGFLLVIPNKYHSTRKCLTQIAYITLTYAGTVGLFGNTAPAFLLMFVGLVLYLIQYYKLKTDEIRVM